MNLNRRYQVSSAVRREGLEWLEKLTSGEATPADAEALLAWRQRGPDHAAALHEAMTVRRACQDLKPQHFAAPRQAVFAHGPLSRRAMFGGAVAAGAAGVAVLGVELNPLGQKADVETGPGMRRTVALNGGGRVELGTATRIAWLHDPRQPGLTLLGGELFVHAGQGSFAVVSAHGKALADQADFNVRCDGDATSITCTQGNVAVSSGRAVGRIAAGQQLAYDARGLGAPAPVDVASVTAWRQGLLVFRNVKLQRVVAELNRYRARPIILASANLADRTVYAVFRTDGAESMVAQISHLAGARAWRLPGGVTLLT